MHELSIATALLDLCLRQLEPQKRLDQVRIAVGELASIEPDLLGFAWQALVAGTPHERAQLAIEWRPARQTCTACGEITERVVGSWLRLCPYCGQPLRIHGGDELDLLELAAAPLVPHLEDTTS